MQIFYKILFFFRNIEKKSKTIYPLYKEDIMKLKELRQQLKKNQVEIAKALNITQEKYSRIENNITDPDIETLIKLADYFHTTVDSIIDHQVPYLIDKSKYNIEQQMLIDEIENLDNEQCRLTKAYIEGLKEGKARREEIIRRLKGDYQ